MGVSVISVDEKYEIDLICYYEDDTELQYKENLYNIVSSIELVKGKITTKDNKLYMICLGIKSIFSKLPLTVLKFLSKEFKCKVNKKLCDVKYEKIYIDHLQIAININIKQNIEVILDEHNCEYIIMKRKFEEENNLIKKIVFGLEYIKLKQYEKKILKNVSKVIALSEQDKNQLVRLGCDTNKIEIIPIPFSDGYIKKDFISNNSEIINILFVGTMSWMPNEEGVLWFIKKVVPLLRNKNLKFKLYIVGKGAGKEICSYNNNVDIEVLGFVESIDNYIELCDCMIVPIFFGSGIRVKIIEAFSKKIPVISTTIGAEGLKAINNHNILIADNEYEFVECIKCMKNAELKNNLINNARKVFEKEYSYNSIKNKFSSFIC